jgi:hypothetical protein
MLQQPVRNGIRIHSGQAIEKQQFQHLHLREIIQTGIQKTFLDTLTVPGMDLSFFFVLIRHIFHLSVGLPLLFGKFFGKMVWQAGRSRNSFRRFSCFLRMLIPQGGYHGTKKCINGNAGTDGPAVF